MGAWKRAICCSAGAGLNLRQELVNAGQTFGALSRSIAMAGLAFLGRSLACDADPTVGCSVLNSAMKKPWQGCEGGFAPGPGSSRWPFSAAPMCNAIQTKKAPAPTL
jgi:hypothetical protein